MCIAAEATRAKVTGNSCGKVRQQASNRGSGDVIVIIHLADFSTDTCGRLSGAGASIRDFETLRVLRVGILRGVEILWKLLKRFSAMWFMRLKDCGWG